MNDSTKSSTSMLEKGDTAPHVSDNNQLSTIKPRSNESIYYSFKELSAFAEVVLNSLKHKKGMTYSEEEVLVLMFSKLEDLTDLYEQLLNKM